MKQELRPYIASSWIELEALAQSRFGDMDHLQKSALRAQISEIPQGFGIL